MERWVRGRAAQMGYLFGLSGLSMTHFYHVYLKICLDIGRVFAKCLIFNEFFLKFTYSMYRLSKSTYASPKGTYASQFTITQLTLKILIGLKKGHSKHKWFTMI